jgi:ligand-binding SRPBCC domain-containing protein
MSRHKERVVAGRSSGRCTLGDEITWEATHFGIRQQLSSRITRFEAPRFFEDQMTRGAFKSIRHEHHFAAQEGHTLMTDIFCYEVPYGPAGWLFNKLVLKRYMTRFLLARNRCIKEAAEAER